MSYPPNQPSYQPPGQSPYKPYGQPYQQMRPPARQSNPWKWILIIGGGGGCLVVVLCCGGMFLAGYAGLGMMADEVKTQVENSPEVRQFIGEVESFETNFNASWDIEDQDVFVYDIKGSLGSGKVTARHTTDSSSGLEVVHEAQLELDDGRIFDITLDNGW